MKDSKRNIEDFLRDKVSRLENNFQDDWSVFEEKLERALFLKRLRIGVALSLLLIATGISIISTNSNLNLHVSENNSFGYPTEGSYVAYGSQASWIPAEASEVSILDASDKVHSDNEVKTVDNTTSLPIDKKQSIKVSTKANENAVATVATTQNLTTTTTAAKAKSSSLANVQLAVTPVPEEEIVSDGLVALASDEVQDRGGNSIVEALKLDVLSHVDFTEELNQKGEIKPSIPAFGSLRQKKKGAYVSPLQSKDLWEFSIKAYPNFTFRKFRVDEDKLNYLHRDFIDQVEQAESGGFSMNVGIEVSRRVGVATYINSGIEYISYKTNADFNFTNFRTAIIDENTGAITNYQMRQSTEQIVISDENSYHYLNFPLSIAYRPWASKHIRLNVEGGISYMRFLSAKGESIDFKTLEKIDLADRNYRKNMGSLNLRVGATYYISPYFNLGFEPTFVYFTNTIYTAEYPFEVIPYSVGVNLKLQVKLN